MRRTTITLTDQLHAALQDYRASQEAPPAVTAVVQRALREFLTDRGFIAGGEARVLRITPSSTGSGRRDISVDHDRYLAEP